MTTIEVLLADLKANHWTAPQPEGREVAAAYERGDMNSEEALYLMAVLLRMVRERETKAAN